MESFLSILAVPLKWLIYVYAVLIGIPAFFLIAGLVIAILFIIVVAILTAYQSLRRRWYRRFPRGPRMPKR